MSTFLSRLPSKSYRRFKFIIHISQVLYQGSEFSENYRVRRQISSGYFWFAVNECFLERVSQVDFGLRAFYAPSWLLAVILCVTCAVSCVCVSSACLPACGGSLELNFFSLCLFFFIQTNLKFRSFFSSTIFVFFSPSYSPVLVLVLYGMLMLPCIRAE